MGVRVSKVYEGATLKDLEEFVASCKAIGIPEDTQVLVRVNARFNSDGGEIRRITTKDVK